MLLSIVSGTYNRLASVQAMIASVRNTLPKGIVYEFVIVDGGSIDGSLDWLRLQPDVVLIEGDLSGAIKAFCDGASAASGKYVVMANDDITFWPDSLLCAVSHLERKSSCGAVAFEDNRYQPYKKHEYEVDVMSARGRHTVVPYAQVGAFRRWLGDTVGWWGYGTIDARTYGGDNYLSARIWELGYSVDAVPGCRITDTVIEDGLRALNRQTDDNGFYKLFPSGPFIPDTPQTEQQDKEQLRILYLPIYENREIQRQQKRGLREALARRGIVAEIDYLNITDPVTRIRQTLAAFKPHIIMTQFHGADNLVKELSPMFRRVWPSGLVVNWNGDYWPHGLTTPDVLHMLQYVDLQLVVNAGALPLYEARGVAAAYWQVAFEPVDESALPEYPAFDVVMLGNCNHVHGIRADIETMLEELHKEHGITYGLYGDGWRTSQGNTLYDFHAGRAIYRNARLAISDTVDSDGEGFVSNRFFEILAAGGATCLQQRILGLDRLLNLQDGIHYYGWSTVEELKQLIIDDLAGEGREDFAKHGNFAARKTREHIHQHHSFDARVDELFRLIDEKAARQIGGTVTVVNTTARKSGGIRGQVTGNQYTYKPGIPVDVDSRDASYILMLGNWEKVG